MVWKSLLFCAFKDRLRILTRTHAPPGAGEFDERLEYPYTESETTFRTYYKSMAAKPTTTEERIARVGQGRQVVIPREILDTLKIQKGDFVAITKQQNGVLIKKRKRVIRPAW
jgi:antidote-toxin recognition MazE-like antitoxin